MSEYPYFQEIINEMQARPEADPVGILEETVGPLVDVCNKINVWIGEYPTWDFSNEPPWYEEFITELTRFDVDLTPIWRGLDWANVKAATKVKGGNAATKVKGGIAVKEAA